MSSFDRGLSAGGVARLSNPAIISKAIPIKTYLPRFFDIDFMAGSLLRGSLPTRPEALLLIESFSPAKVVRRFRRLGTESAVIHER